MCLAGTGAARQARCTRHSGRCLAAVAGALLDDPVLQLANAHRYHLRDAAPAAPYTAGAWPPPEQTGPRRLRIGYVSSDMREHAVGYLTAELFALHDRDRVEVFAYYCGPEREDALQARFRVTADHWTDIGKMTDPPGAAAIVGDRIDILIDLNGYTKDGRIKLFGYRPAPCIVNWLGFPGTTGSPHHHYIIADDFIIPPEDEIFYTEKVLRLPCYQPNDRQRVVAADGMTRAEAGLPEGAFVFCVFNGPHKITAEMFATWMAILRGVPGSVLWVLCADEEVCARLRAHAVAAGIDATHLVFAGREPNARHLSRYRLADLFLDTAPYGAHTTASDALWMGVPVLTVAGRGFAARVCASLVRAAGVPELVCENWPPTVHWRWRWPKTGRAWPRWRRACVKAATIPCCSTRRRWWRGWRRCTRGSGRIIARTICRCRASSICPSITALAATPIVRRCLTAPNCWPGGKPAWPTATPYNPWPKTACCGPCVRNQPSTSPQRKGSGAYWPQWGGRGQSPLVFVLNCAPQPVPAGDAPRLPPVARPGSGSTHRRHRRRRPARIAPRRFRGAGRHRRRLAGRRQSWQRVPGARNYPR
ncbi:MAG: hypothetical protein WDN04_05920 [Rhodospirillales bacterium]